LRARAHVWHAIATTEVIVEKTCARCELRRCRAPREDAETLSAGFLGRRPRVTAAFGRLVTVGLGLLVFVAVPSRGAEVFPERMCEKLPQVDPEVKSWIADVAPELVQARVHELSEKTALEVFGRAAAAGWGGIDLFTQSVFRGSCVFYLSSEALRAVDASFDFDLLTVIRGKDKKGEIFEMRGILAGRGKLLVFYDRDGIVYWNERHHRDFMLASRVEFDSPDPGRFENVHGLCARVLLLGCVEIRSIVKDGDIVTVRAGLFTSESHLRPIRAR
jgi:hypothetical protein